VYLINSLGAGGAELHLLDLARDMVRRGHLVWVVDFKKDIPGGARNLKPDFEAAGINVVHLKSAGLSEIGLWSSLVLLLKKVHPDVLHSHLPRSDVAASWAKWFCPDVMWISTIHDGYTKTTYSGHWVVPIFRWTWRRADHFIAVSNRAREWGMHSLGLPMDKVTVIYHGISLRELPDVSPGPSGPPFFIGCLARFEKRKGLETLVKAMPEVSKVFPDAQLLLAGSDPKGYANTLRDLAKALAVERNVRIQGFCETPLEFLRDLDIFVFASTAEGFGIVLLEAMAMRRPVVASNIYPINHIIQDGASGVLVDPDNPQAFAEAIIRLLRDPARRSELGEAAHQRVMNEFSLMKTLDSTYALYLDMLRRRPPICVA